MWQRARKHDGEHTEHHNGSSAEDSDQTYTRLNEESAGVDSHVAPASMNTKRNKKSKLLTSSSGMTINDSPAKRVINVESDTSVPPSDSEFPDKGKARSRDAVVNPSLSFSCCSPSCVSFYVPMVNWLPKYSLRQDLIGDVLAGLTVGMMVVPQAMAYAQIAKLPVLVGLYTAFIGCILYAPFGTSKDLNIGPTSVLSLVVLASYMPDAVGDSEAAQTARLHQAMFLCFYAGFWQLLFGVFKLGVILDFISHPVISAYTSASALTIASVQITNLTGIKVSDTFVVNLYDLFDNITMISYLDTLLGLSCMAVLVSLGRLKHYQRDSHFLIWLICTGRNAIVVGLATMVSAIFINMGHMPFVTVPSMFMGSYQYPTFQFAFFQAPTTSNILSFTTSSIAIASIGILEGIAVAKAFAKQNKYIETLRPSQELVANGVIQLFGSIVGCYPMGGSFSRTAVNSAAGIRTSMGGIISGLIVLLALLFLTSFFHYIPQASLAAVIMTAVWTMVDFDLFIMLYRLGEPMSVRIPSPLLAYVVDFILIILGGLITLPFMLWRRRHHSPAPQAWWDCLTMVVTFWGCLFLSVEWGILLGVTCSIFITIGRGAQPQVVIMIPTPSQSTTLKNTDTQHQETQVLTWIPLPAEANSGYSAVNTDSSSTDAYLSEIRQSVMYIKVEASLMYFNASTVLHMIKEIEENRYMEPQHKAINTTTATAEADIHQSDIERLPHTTSSSTIPIPPSLSASNLQSTSSNGLLRNAVEEEALRELEEHFDSFSLSCPSSLRVLIVDLSSVNDMDTSGMRALETMIRELHTRSPSTQAVSVYFIGTHPDTQQFLIRSYNTADPALFVDTSAAEYFYADIDVLMMHVEKELGLRGYQERRKYHHRIAGHKQDADTSTPVPSSQQYEQQDDQERKEAPDDVQQIVDV